MTKIEARISPFRRIAENSDEFTRKPPWQKLLFKKIAVLEAIHVILLKTDSIREVFLYEFSKKALFKSYVFHSFFC